MGGSRDDAHDTAITDGRGGLTRRRLLQAGAAAAGAGALAGAEGAGAHFGGPWWSRPGAGGITDRFARPGREVQPKFRWWWPDGLVDPREIAREIDQIADAGFGGVEIAAVRHSMREPLDVVRHGWGTDAWNAGVEAALRQARKRGVTVDVTVGPSWPAAVPTVTPDDEAAVKELAHGVAFVAAGETFGGPPPEPAVAPHEHVTQRRLLAVQTARVAAGSPTDRRPHVLDAETIETLPAAADGEPLDWTAPADPAGAQHVVIAYWERGSGQRPERGPHTEPLSFVVDHFSDAGTHAIVDFWERNLLTREIRRLLRDVGGALYEDSIEMETDATLWTPRMPQEFAARLGYELLPVLAAVVEQDEKPVFDFADGRHGRIRRDFNEAITELYIDRHLKPLQAWAHTIGLQLRIQPYGLDTDAMTKAAIVDVPEGESLGFKNLDDFRSLAGGRDVGGRLILSNEAGGLAGGAYGTTWDATLRRLTPQYAAGVNQAVFHGFAYATVPEAQWPGFAAFSPYDGGPGYGEAWGPRQPTWRHAGDVSGYLSRTQQILQTGVNKVDVAWLRQRGYAGSGFGAAWFTAEGNPIGWTHQFLSPRLLHFPAMRVTRGRLAPDGPAYKVLVFEGDVFAGRETTLQLDTAERLLAFAKAGLPIVVVGDWSRPRVPGVGRPGDDEQLARLVGELLAQPAVRNVADRPNIPEGLAALGIRRDVEIDARSTLQLTHRVDGSTDYHYLVNGHASAVASHLVTFTPTARDAVPYTLDAWTGEVERIAAYERLGDGRIRTRVTLKPGETTIVALAKPRGWDRWLGSGVHATSTEADRVVIEDGSLAIRAAAAGTYATTLSDGRVARAPIADVAAPIALDAWELEVEDWQPGASATETNVVKRRLQLAALRSWPEIAGLEDVSGIGRYRTTVTLSRGWTGGCGAYLELGEVFDTFRVEVNGRRLAPADQLDTVVDLRGALRRGRNTIVVEVATTLNNRLRVSRPDVFAGNRRQAYGLVGPVRLVPYGQAAVRAGRR